MLETRDDRGAAVRAFRPNLLLMLRFNLAGKRGALPHAVCQRGLRRCGWHPLAGVVFGACVVGLMGVAVLLILVWHMPRGLPGSMLLGMSMSVVMAASFFAVIALSPRLAWGRWVEVVVGAGHCASCGQTLEGLPAGGDGCRVCPECGAAWLEKRLGR